MKFARFLALLLSLFYFLSSVFTFNLARMLEYQKTQQLAAIDAEYGQDEKTKKLAEKLRFQVEEGMPENMKNFKGISQTFGMAGFVFTFLYLLAALKLLGDNPRRYRKFYVFSGILIAVSIFRGIYCYSALPALGMPILMGSLLVSLLMLIPHYLVIRFREAQSL